MSKKKQIINPVTKKNVFISTITITDSRIWQNGLFQNIFFLYKLFENNGYYPYLLLGEKKPDKDCKELDNFRTICIYDYQKSPFPLYVYIEMALSFTEDARLLFKKNGAKILKLHLGNNLNFDIENTIFTTDESNNKICNAPGKLDYVLLSPHYDFHKEYVSVIHGTYPQQKIAPYVWDSCLIGDLENIHVWKENGPYAITIIEPNISFQKCSLVPIMICELFYRNNPGTFEGAIVVNGYNMTKHEYFNETILGNLDIHRKGKIHLIKRCALRQICQTFKSNIVILHAVNNDYNYVFLEHLLMGFPVLHNYATLKQYGYYYEGDNILAGYKLLETVINFHKLNIKKYKERNLPLLQKFKIDNPENIIEWKKILDMKIV
jgi:hypothetical protein